MRSLTSVFLAFVLAFALSCNNGTSSTKDGTCANNADCPDNHLCQEDECIEIGCSESSDCALGYFCDDTYTCTTGCSEDIDCVAGETCDTTTNTCGAYGCRDTELDCEYGEYCDLTSGECYPDTRDLCSTCDALIGNNTCSQGSECVAWTDNSCNNDNDCDAGYSCDLFGFHGNYCHRDFCMYQCNASDEDACPRGFSCLAIYTNYPTTYCYADCDYMVDNGFLQ